MEARRGRSQKSPILRSHRLWTAPKQLLKSATNTGNRLLNIKKATGRGHLQLKIVFFFSFPCIFLLAETREYVLRRELKTDSYSKDLLFLTCVAFCVITFEPIMIQTCSAPQNDRLIFSFVKDIKVGVKKMTRNPHKMIEKTANSLLLSKHSIQFSALFLLLSVSKSEFAFRPFLRAGHLIPIEF